jgi:catechol 2,3-dioxygenase-like lactoylglutathione lyase family enzyme
VTEPTTLAKEAVMEWKLELIVLPVADVDRAKQFYAEQLGFKLEVDYQPTEDFRVVQLTPVGSRCSVALMRNHEAAGSVKGLHLMVTDIDAARTELAGRGIEVSEVFHFENGQQRSGPDPQRGDYNSFASFSDPDGNEWLVQERKKDPYES